MKKKYKKKALSIKELNEQYLAKKNLQKLTDKEIKKRKLIAVTKKGLVKANRFFQGMGDGLDKTLGIPVNRKDYILITRVKKRRKKY
jgi:hypothetical protein